MESRREELKRRVQAAPKMPWGPRRYGAELKRDVTEYGRERQAEGVTLRKIAEELGLSAWSLMKWMRWAKTLIEAGKVPFEPSRRRSGKAQANVQKDARPEPESQRSAEANESGEAQPEVSEERTLVFLVRLSDVHVESATRDQLCEWLRGQGRPGPTRQVARERGTRASART